MHEVLALLVQIDERDRAIYALQRSVAKEQGLLDDAQTQAGRALEILGAADTALERSRKTEHELSRKAHMYKQRRASALRVLESGIGDISAAERQLEQCEAILDDTETDQLELMDRQDTERVAQAAATTALQAARAAVAAQEARVPPELARLQGEITAEQAARATVLAKLPRETRARYQTFQDKRRWAVAKVTNGACGACRMVVPAQQLADLKRGVPPEPCRGCHRWIVP